METSSSQAVKFQQIEAKSAQLVRPAMSAPQLVSRSTTELTIRWNPWTTKQSEEQSDPAAVEYSVEWQQGSGHDGAWSTVPGVLDACELTRKNLRPSTTYSFRVRARLVSPWLWLSLSIRP